MYLKKALLLITIRCVHSILHSVFTFVKNIYNAKQLTATLNIDSAATQFIHKTISKMTFNYIIQYTILLMQNFCCIHSLVGAKSDVYAEVTSTNMTVMTFCPHRGMDLAKNFISKNKGVLFSDSVHSIFIQCSPL